MRHNAGRESVLSQFIVYDRNGEENNFIASLRPSVHPGGGRFCEMTIQASDTITLSDGFDNSRAAPIPHRIHSHSAVRRPLWHDRRQPCLRRDIALWPARMVRLRRACARIAVQSVQLISAQTPRTGISRISSRQATPKAVWNKMQGCIEKMPATERAIKIPRWNLVDTEQEARLRLSLRQRLVAVGHGMRAEAWVLAHLC